MVLFLRECSTVFIYSAFILSGAGSVDRFIPFFMDQHLRTFDRTGVTSAGNNLLQNHYPHHLVGNIRRGGSPQNSNSGIGESLHVTTAKRTGRRTNMHHGSFEPSTGRRLVENLTVDRVVLDLLGSRVEHADEGVTYGGRVCLVRAKRWTNGTEKKWVGRMCQGRRGGGVCRRGQKAWWGPNKFSPSSGI